MSIEINLSLLEGKKSARYDSEKLKPLLKRYCVLCMKDSAKEDLLRSLRGVLFERKVVTRKDKSEEVITLSNLRTVI